MELRAADRQLDPPLQETVSPIHEPTVGQIANQVANHTAHHRYHKTKAKTTRRRQIADLQCFFRFLAAAHYEHPMTPFLQALKTGEPLHDLWPWWDGITHGLVEAFLPWQEAEGYAIGSIGVRLSTVKAYCTLAARAGAIAQPELAMIRIVEGYSHREGRNLDATRTLTRTGHKKATPTIISSAHAALLKRQPRPKDAAMLCLLLDLGLRCSELASLPVSAVNLAAGTLTFYREKVDLTQTHRLTPDCLVALQTYLPTLSGPYLFPGHKDRVTKQPRPMSPNGVNKRVGELGDAIGVEELSPHDCRHHLLTEEARKGTDAKTLQWIGGWSSPAQALTYVNDAEIANARASFFRQGEARNL